MSFDYYIPPNYPVPSGSSISLRKIFLLRTYGFMPGAYTTLMSNLGEDVTQLMVNFPYTTSTKYLDFEPGPNTCSIDYSDEVSSIPAQVLAPWNDLSVYCPTFFMYGMAISNQAKLN